MADMLIGQLLGWVLTASLGGLSGALVSMLRKSRSQESAMQEGMRALLRQQLIDMHRKYVVEGRPCSVDEHEQAEDVYKAYHALGGNGTGTHLYEEIRESHVSA